MFALTTPSADVTLQLIFILYLPNTHSDIWALYGELSLNIENSVLLFIHQCICFVFPTRWEIS